MTQDQGPTRREEPAAAPVPPRDSLVLRGCLHAIHLASIVVPRQARDDWRQEWEAELRAHARRAQARRTQARHTRDPQDSQDSQETLREDADHPRRHARADNGDRSLDMRLIRRTLGALPDAAWLRRQCTLDADIVQDMRYGLRLLERSPAFAVLAITMLAIGIGAGTTIFSLVDALLLRDLPYTDADRVVTLWQIDTRRTAEPDETAPGNLADWRTRARTMTIAAAEPFSLDYTGAGEPEVLKTARVTEQFFETVGIRPLLGRTFAAGDYVPGHERVAILSHALWQRSFGSRQDILGHVIPLDNEPYTIVGVLPPSVELRLMGNGAERGIWVPKIFTAQELRTRTARGWWDAVARLHPGVTLAQAEAEMATIARQLAAEYPQTLAGVDVRLVPLRDHLAGRMRTPLLVLLGAVGLVLLLACANVANLLLARSATRTREFAVRTALGASRTRLARQMLAEGGVLASLGALGGLALAWWGIRFVVSLMPADTPRVGSTQIDGRLLAFSLALTAGTVLLFALAPALQISRDDRRGLLRGVGRTATQGTRRLSKALLIVETAFALLLLVGSGLLFRSFLTLVTVNPGFVKENLLAVQVFVWDRQRTPEARAAFFKDTVDRMSTLPGVRSVGVASAVPFMPANIGIRSTVIVEGRPQPRPNEEPATFVTAATPGYFPTMGVPLAQGRLFTDRDTGAMPKVALINDVLRRQLWPTGDPIHQRVAVRWYGKPTSVEIVGVVGSLRHESLERQERPELFIPHAQFPFGSMTYVVRAHGDAASLTRTLKAQVWAVDKLQTVYDTALLDQLVSESLRERRFSLHLLGLFAGIALVLATIGIYGVVAVSTAQRTQEIGIRVALGATSGRIRALVLGQGLATVSVGVVVGLLAAAILTRALRSLLYGVSPFDPLTLIGAVLVLLVAASAAAYIPARRATRIDPLTAFRAE